MSQAIDPIALARCLIQHEQYARANLLLERHLNSCPSDVDALVLLGSLSRILGRPQEAEALYRRALSVGGERPLRRVRALLAGEAEEDRLFGPGIVSAPFARFPDFLPKDRVEELFAIFGAHRAHFGAAHVAAERLVQPMVRNNLRLWNEEQQEAVGRWFRPLLERALTDCVDRLHVRPLAIERIEIKLGCYQHGAFFRLHRDDLSYADDSVPDAGRLSRKISFVYYFHREPKAFTGGHLRLYPTDRAVDLCSVARFQSVVPESNLLVCFPSGFYHEVTEVRETTGDLLNSRLTVNGHVLARADEGPREP